MFANNTVAIIVIVVITIVLVLIYSLTRQPISELFSGVSNGTSSVQFTNVVFDEFRTLYNTVSRLSSFDRWPVSVNPIQYQSVTRDQARQLVSAVNNLVLNRNYTRWPVPSTEQPAPQPVSIPVSTPVPTPVPVPSPVPTPTSTTTTTSSTVPVDNIWVKEHNRIREMVGVAPLTWNENIAQRAESYAQELANQSNCLNLRHSDISTRRFNNTTLGENLAVGTGKFTPDTAIGLWEDERRLYTPGQTTSQGLASGAGHYTQIVNPNAREVGCKCEPCQGGSGSVCVCQYNRIQFASEVPYR